MAVIVDTIWPAIDSLAGCVEATLAAYGQPACKVFVAPGGPPAWDHCCECDVGEGQAWVQVDRIVPSDGFPQPAGPARCRPAEFAVTVSVGVLRCAATVTEYGDAPSADRLTADAFKVQTDRLALFDAVYCCFVDGFEPGTWQVGQWTPLGPAGGCVGGLLQISFAAEACACPPLPSGFGLTPFGQDFGG